MHSWRKATEESFSFSFSITCIISCALCEKEMEIGGEDFLIFHFVVAQVMCAFLSHSVSLFLFFALAFCAD